MRYSALACWVSVCFALASNNLQAFDLMTLCPSDVRNYMACSELVEAKALASTPQANRQGDALHIQGSLGQDLVFLNESDQANEVQSKHYFYLAYLPKAKAHLLHVLFYEGSSYLLVHADTGAIQILDGYPLMSANHNYFAVATASLDFGPTLLQIWQITKNGFKLEYSMEPSAWGPGDVVWLDDTTLRVPTNGYASYQIDVPANVPANFRLELVAKKWALTPE